MNADIVIAGAGLAGLTLAAELADEPGGPRVVLFDPRTSWENDRTWSFWARTDDPILALSSRVWTQWAVAADRARVVRSAPGEVYAHLPSDRVYDALLARIEASRRVEIVAGVAVDELVDEGPRVRVRAGTLTVMAERAVDTRPPALGGAAPPGERRLLQHFLGWHVRTTTPCFDPAVVELMDFQRGPELRFRYVLPYGPREALVEDTWFSAAPVPPAVYREALAAWLNGHARAWEVLREERGVLPMTTERWDPHPSPRVYRLGLGGGAARPSTGYAFLGIRRGARSLADVLLGRAKKLPALRTWRSYWLDAVFLEWLAVNPDKGPTAFLHMFQDAEPGALVRFLSDRSSVGDDLAVVRALAPIAGSDILHAGRRRVEGNRARRPGEEAA